MRQYLGISLKAGLLVAVAYLVRYGFTHGHLSDADIQGFVSRAGVLAAPGFIALSALGLLAFAPPPLLIGSGALMFGNTLGSLYSLIGLVLGVGLAFPLGRYALTGFAHRLKKGWLKRIDEWVAFNGLAGMVGLRLVFFVNPAFNYVASLTNVTFRDYLLGSFIGCLPSVFILSYVCDAFVHTGSLVDLFKHPAVIAMWLLQLGGVVLLLGLTRRYRKHQSSNQSGPP